MNEELNVEHIVVLVHAPVVESFGCIVIVKIVIVVAVNIEIAVGLKLHGFDYNPQLLLHCSDPDRRLHLHIRFPVVIFWIGSRPLDPVARYSYMLAAVAAGNNLRALVGVENFAIASAVVAVVRIDFGSVDR